MTEESSLTIQLTVTGVQGQPRVPLTIPSTITCTELRKQTSEKTKIPLPSLKLIFRGRLVADDDSKAAVTEYKLEEGSVLHCMGKPASDSSAAVAAPAAAATATATSIVPPAALPIPAIPNTALPSSAVPAPSAANPLQAAFQMIRASSSPPDYLTAVTTLDKILGNIVNNPMEEKYRKVKKQNAAFQRRLGGRVGGDAAMKAAGFVTQQDEGEEVYMMHASAEAWPKLMAAKATVEAAVRDAKNAANQPTAPPPVVPPMGTPGGMSGSFGNLPPGNTGGMMGSPEMQRAAAELMSNPTQLQAMMQNPMVQNMIRNHPQFANNPMGQQMMEQMMNNPEMIAQVSQMMRDPAMMNRMQAMMGGGGVPGNAAPPAFSRPPTNNASNAQQGSSSSGETDEQMTEEEMIAEAIRRSLQDGS